MKPESEFQLCRYRDDAAQNRMEQKISDDLELGCEDEGNNTLVAGWAMTKTLGSLVFSA